MIKPETVQKILDTARIEEVVGDFVSLKKRGANLMGLCPFHNEKTPSFVVSPAKGIFKCFGCGKAGNAVHFIMEHEHYSYPEALKYLAAKYDIFVEESERTPEEIIKDDLKDKLFNINSFAQKYFTDTLLNSQQGKLIGLAYFKERGFTDDTIKQFQLGYCLDSFDSFTNNAEKNGYKKDILSKSGLVIVKEEDNKMFDRFRDRVIFPIHNLTGRVIGFGGRIMTADKNRSKYINSPETDIYHKSETLYGIYFAKQAIVSQNVCFLVEGYTDVISMHQAGFKNVVASSGTSLTVEQIRLIKRFTKNITIIYDGDYAGIKASLRGIDMVLEEGLNVRIVPLPPEDDPDSFVKNNRTSFVIDYLKEKTEDFISFKTNLLLQDAQNDPIKKAEVIRDVVHSISLIPDAISRSVYLKECSNLMETKEQILINEVNKDIAKKYKNLPQKDFSETEAVTTAVAIDTDDNILPPSDLYFLEKDVIEKILLYGDFRSVYPEHDDDEISTAQYIIDETLGDNIEFSEPAFQKILNIFKDGAQQDVVPDEKTFINHLDKDVATTAANLISSRYSISDNWKEYKVYINDESSDISNTVIRSIYSLKAARIKILRENLHKRMEISKDEEEITNLLETDKKYKEFEILINKYLNRIIT